MKFGEKVRALRIEHHMSQTQLAEEIGVSIRTIGSYEHGYSYPKNRILYDVLARTLHCEVSYLKNEDDDEISMDLKTAGVLDDADLEVAEEANELLYKTAQMFRNKEVPMKVKDKFTLGVLQLLCDTKEKQEAEEQTPVQPDDSAPEEGNKEEHESNGM